MIAEGHSRRRPTSNMRDTVQGSVGQNANLVTQLPEVSMNLHISMGPLLSLIAGILILIVPRLLNYIVAIYLIAMGLIGLFGTGALR
jgi:hypothetical protein